MLTILSLTDSVLNSLQNDHYISPNLKRVATLINKSVDPSKVITE